MSVFKTGILTSNDFIEEGYLINTSNGWSYTPVVDATNSCASSIIIDFSAFAELNQPLQFTIEADLAWGDFTGSPGNTAGTFNTHFQGANRKISTNAFEWTGTNYVTSALDSKAHPKTLITNAVSGGSYHYLTTCTIPASWFATYNGSYLSFRTDYRKGNGAITLSNLKVSFAAAINGPFTAKINKNYIASNHFYEY